MEPREVSHYCPFPQHCCEGAPGLPQPVLNPLHALELGYEAFFYYYYYSGNPKQYPNVPVKYWTGWQWKCSSEGSKWGHPRCVLVPDTEALLLHQPLLLPLCYPQKQLLKGSRNSLPVLAQDRLWLQLRVPGACTENHLCEDDLRQQLKRELSISLLVSAEHQDRNWIIFRCQNTT